MTPNHGLHVPSDYSHLNLNPINDQAMAEIWKSPSSNPRFNLYGKYGHKYRKGSLPSIDSPINQSALVADIGPLQKRLKKGLIGVRQSIIREPEPRKAYRPTPIAAAPNPS